MICQRCGDNEATIHLVELIDGQRTSQWLCAECANRSGDDGDQEPDFEFGDDPGEDADQEDVYSLASFLGQVFEPGESAAAKEIPPCICGWTLEQFRQTNTLGCPRCYETFRRPLLAILSHLHRHVSHLGKVPGGDERHGSVTTALSRTRVALEKAIAGENFEEAARLRDEIQRLESGQPPAGDPSP